VSSRTAAQAEINHSARVLAERVGVPADARVIRLRRTAPSDTTGHPAVTGSTAGVVRMHKVRQS
jgi:hypothetical protein